MALSECGVATDERDRELKKHGTEGFPVACYHDDLQQSPVAWHWHDEWEAACIELGECVVSTGTEEKLLKAGEALFLNSGILHMCECTKAGGTCKLKSVVFSPSLIGGTAGSIFWERYLQPVLQNSGLRLLHLTGQEKWEKEAARHILTAWEACAKEPEAFEIIVRNELSSFAALLAANVPVTESNIPISDVRRENRIKQMLAYIREHYPEELDTQSIAASANVSESEALRCFKQMLGTTPIRYLVSYRLEKAETLLTTTDLMVSEIGERCGFHEMSYFAKAFHKRNGCTPKEYRAKHR